MLGNTKIRIFDDAYKNKTQEDIDNTLKRIAEIYLRSIKRREINEAEDGSIKEGEVIIQQ